MVNKIAIYCFEECSKSYIIVLISKSKQAITLGAILRRDYPVPLGTTQEQLSKHLGGSWTQSKINKTLNNERAVIAEDALDFADAFGIDAKMWLKMQMEEDLKRAKETHQKIE